MPHLLVVRDDSPRAFADGLGALDAALFHTVAEAPSPLLDRLMPPVSRAADHGKLWLAIAAVLGATGRPADQRAAMRGTLTLAATSLLTNQVAKRIRPRPRPSALLVALPRRGRRQPSSNSFPSGHAASAAAFAVGAAVESRPLGLGLAALAGVVGLSRVAVGAHYPGDVVAGWGLGAAIAVLGAQLVPRIDEHGVAGAPPTPVAPRPRPSGAGVTVLINTGSGDGTATDAVDLLRTELPDARLVEYGPDDDLAERAAEAAADAEVLAVLGGDGTVAVAAEAALAAAIPLAVFPGGTFNHFAHDIGCATVADTVQALRAGALCRVDAVRLNGTQLILNTASIGAYPEFVRYRQRYQRHIGRVAAAARACVQVMRRTSPVTVTIDGRTRSTSLFLLGNGIYQPPGFVPTRRRRLDDGLLDVRFIEAGHRFGVARLVAAALTGQLPRSRVYHEMQVPEFSFTAADPVTIAHDGEAGREHRQARFTVLYRALQVYGTAVVE